MSATATTVTATGARGDVETSTMRDLVAADPVLVSSPMWIASISASPR
jgi:hypothetical protein